MLHGLQFNNSHVPAILVKFVFGTLEGKGFSRLRVNSVVLDLNVVVHHLAGILIRRLLCQVETVFHLGQVAECKLVSWPVIPVVFEN